MRMKSSLPSVPSLFLLYSNASCCLTLAYIVYKVQGCKMYVRLENSKHTNGQGSYKDKSCCDFLSPIHSHLYDTYRQSRVPTSHSSSTLDWRLAFVRDLSFMYIYVCLQVLDGPLVILQIDVLILILRLLTVELSLKIFKFLAKKVCKGCYMTLFLLVSKSSLKQFSFKKIF